MHERSSTLGTWRDVFASLIRNCCSQLRVVRSMNHPASCEEATAWWGRSDVGMEQRHGVKPLNFVSKGRRGFVQPAIKCRGPEYPRIIYGPEYLLPDNLDACVPEESARSGRWPAVNSRSGLRRWSALSAKNHCAGRTSAHSECWLWKVNPWICVEMTSGRFSTRVGSSRRLRTEARERARPAKLSGTRLP